MQSYIHFRCQKHFSLLLLFPPMQMKQPVIVFRVGIGPLNAGGPKSGKKEKSQGKNFTDARALLLLTLLAQ